MENKIRIVILKQGACDSKLIKTQGSSCFLISGEILVKRLWLYYQFELSFWQVEKFTTKKINIFRLSCFARNLRQALLAAASIGGEVSQIFKLFLWKPMILFLDDLSWFVADRRILFLCFFIGIGMKNTIFFIFKRFEIISCACFKGFQQIFLLGL